MALKQGVTAVVASLALGWGASTMSFAADQPSPAQVSTDQVAFQVQEMQQELTEMQERIAELNQVVAELQQKTTKRENQGRTGR